MKAVAIGKKLGLPQVFSNEDKVGKSGFVLNLIFLLLCSIILNNISLSLCIGVVVPPFFLLCMLNVIICLANPFGI